MYTQIGKGPLKPFQITLGLRAGYDGDNVFSAEEVEEHIGEWMRGRILNNKPFLTGTVFSGTLVYAWPSPVGDIPGAQKGTEPSAIFTGDVNPLYNAELSDEEVLEILKDLSFWLGERLKQTRVYLSYNGKLYIFQDEEKSHPTEEE